MRLYERISSRAWQTITLGWTKTSKTTWMAVVTAGNPSMILNTITIIARIYTIRSTIELIGAWNANTVCCTSGTF